MQITSMRDIMAMVAVYLGAPTERPSGYAYPAREGGKPTGAASAKRAASKRRNIRARSKK